MNSTNPNDAWLTPAQMADRTGVNIDTLRYYEREGLINKISRSPSGHRRYSAGDISWIEVLRCLRDTGMSIEQLRQYCELGEQGDHTQPERLALLLQHKSMVQEKIAKMQKSISLIDHKIDFYRTTISQQDKS